MFNLIKIFDTERLHKFAYSVIDNLLKNLLNSFIKYLHILTMIRDTFDIITFIATTNLKVADIILMKLPSSIL